MENTVTLSLEKYNELIKEQEKLKDFEMANTIAEFYPFRGYYPVYKTNDDAVAQIINELQKAYSNSNEKSHENFLLKDSIKKVSDNLLKFKSFFGLYIIKRKTIEKLIKEFYEKQV